MNKATNVKRMRSESMRHDELEETLWAGTRGQIANLWLYTYCLFLCWLILPIVYALWRALETHFHTYELTRESLFITMGLFRPHFHVEEIELSRIQSVKVQGPSLYRLVGRGNVVLERDSDMNPILIEGVRDPESVKDTIDKAIANHRASSTTKPIA